MALEQKSVVVKKGSDWDKQRYVRKSSFQRGRKEPALEQEQSEVNRRVQTRIRSNTSEKAGSNEEERNQPQSKNRPKSARRIWIR